LASSAQASPTVAGLAYSNATGFMNPRFSLVST
jgi:hypothetical protein